MGSACDSVEQVNNILEVKKGTMREDNWAESKIYIKILWLLHGIATVFLVLLSIKTFIEGNILLGITDIIVMGLLILNGIIMYVWKKYHIAAYSGCSIIGAFFLYLLMSGGVEETGGLWAYSFPLIALFTLKRKAGTVLTICFLMLIMAGFFIPENPFLIVDYSLNFKIRFLGSLIVVFFVTFMYEYIREKTGVSLAKSKESIRHRTEELEEMIEVMEDQGRRLDTIVNSMTDGLLAIDSDDNIVFMNARMNDILGLQFSECAGQNIRNAIKDESILNRLINIIRSDSRVLSEHNHVYIKSPDDNMMQYYLVKVSNFNDGTGAVVGRIINFINETEKMKFEKLRNSFLTIVSHELRTPITILMNYLSILKIKMSNKKTIKEILDDMEKAGTRLKYLINNIMAIASLSDSTVRLTQDEANVENLIRVQVEKLKPEAMEKSVFFTIRNQMKNPCIMIDSKILSIALNCLISNAIKFNKRNGEVEIGLVTQQHNGVKSLHVTIMDQGIGISQKHQDDLFESFVQADDPMTRRFHGIGIGLFLAKRTMQILNGAIDIASAKGEGTTVTLEIPLKNDREIKKSPL